MGVTFYFRYIAALLAPIILDYLLITEGQTIVETNNFATSNKISSNSILYLIVTLLPYFALQTVLLKWPKIIDKCR